MTGDICARCGATIQPGQRWDGDIGPRDHRFSTLRPTLHADLEDCVDALLAFTADGPPTPSLVAVAPADCEDSHGNALHVGSAVKVYSTEEWREYGTVLRIDTTAVEIDLGSGGTIVVAVHDGEVTETAHPKYGSITHVVAVAPAG